MNGEMALSYIAEGTAAGDLFIIDGYSYPQALEAFNTGAVWEANFNLVPLQVGTNTITDGPQLSDHLQGDARSEMLMGMAGRDLLEGRDGNDILIGDRMSLNSAQRLEAMNILNSGNYPDFSSFTFTGNGADSLWGGQGVDILIGGEGADGFGFRPEDLDSDADWIIDFEARVTYTDNNGNQRYYSDYIDLTAFKVDNGESGRADIVYVNGSISVDLSSADIVIDTSGGEYAGGYFALSDLTSNQMVTGADNEFFYVWQDYDLDVRLSYVEDFDHDGLFNPDEISDIAILTNLNPDPNSPFDMNTLNQDHFLINNIQAMTYQWSGGASKLGSTNITYNFAPDGTEFENSGGSNIGILSDAAKQAITDALTLWSESNGLIFTLADNSVSADWSFGLGVNSEGWDIKTIHNNIGEKNFWLSVNDFGSLADGQWAPGAMGMDGSAFSALLRNIGHQLGLQQPQQYHDWENPPYIRPDLDDGSITVLNWDGDTNWPTEVWTPMMLDHQAMQFLYGVDTETRNVDPISTNPSSGNTKYGYNAADDYTYRVGETPGFGTPMDHLNFTDNGPVPVGVIWDSGGDDAILAPQNATPAIIDLREGHFSSLGGLTDNIGIAEGTVIERAFGGAGDDSITGNSADNILGGKGGNDILRGLGGDDRIWGDDGDDILIGGTGKDRMWGGAGADTFVVGEPEVFDPLDNSTSSWWIADNIFDFSFAEGDKIDIRDVLQDVNSTDDINTYLVTEEASYVDTDGVTQEYTQLRLLEAGGNSSMLTNFFFTNDGGVTYSGYINMGDLITHDSFIYTDTV